MNSPSNYRSLFPVLAVLVATRVLFIALKPEMAVSFDMHSWWSVAQEFQANRNPYHTTGVLNWPPFWPAVLFALAAVCQTFSELQLGVQLLLCFGEVVLCLVLFPLLTEFVSSTRARSLILWGIALNPLCLFLTVQHLNFDVFVAIFIAAFAHQLSLWQRSANPEHWTRACLYLGIGIFIKTAPILLIPLLLTGIRAVPAKIRIGGALRLALPYLIGIGFIALSAPDDVLGKVVFYHSYGRPMLPIRLGHLGVSFPIVVWHFIFLFTLLSLQLSTATFCIFASCARNQTLVLHFLLLALVPILGFGSGHQYFLWLIPAFLTLYPLATKRVLTLMLGTAVITNCTIIFDYLIDPQHGALLQNWGVSLPRGYNAFLDIPWSILGIFLFVIWIALITAFAKVIPWEQGLRYLTLSNIRRMLFMRPI